LKSSEINKNSNKAFGKYFYPTEVHPSKISKSIPSKSKDFSLSYVQTGPKVHSSLYAADKFNCIKWDENDRKCEVDHLSPSGVEVKKT
jgi:hypothetical protein